MLDRSFRLNVKKSMQGCMIYITTETEEEAERIASHAIEERLAACANIIPGMKSVFRWEGKIQTGEEIILILKSRMDLLGRITDRVAELHSFSCPCIVALPIADGNPEFLQWIEDETR